MTSFEAFARMEKDNGSRDSLTVRRGPDQSPSFEMLYSAVRAYGYSSIALPPGPDFHQFANRDVASALLIAAGFHKRECTMDGGGQC